MTTISKRVLCVLKTLVWKVYNRLNEQSAYKDHAKLNGAV